MELLAIIPLFAGTILFVTIVSASVTATIVGIVALRNSNQRKHSIVGIGFGIGAIIIVTICTTMINLYRGI